METDLGCVCTTISMTNMRRDMFVTLSNPDKSKPKCPGVALNFSTGERLCYQVAFSNTDYVKDMSTEDVLALLQRPTEMILLILPIMKALRPGYPLLKIELGDLRLNNNQEMTMSSAYYTEDVSLYL